MSRGLGSGTTNGVNGNIVGTQSAPQDPNLGLFQFNGGPTKTLALRQGSVALNSATTIPAVTKDQRGVPRSQGGPVPDMGAYELNVTL